jgi:hypothetical protein
MRPSKKHNGEVITIKSQALNSLGVELKGLYIHRDRARTFSFLVDGGLLAAPCVFERADWVVVGRPAK